MRIIPAKPLYKWISYWATWHRVLMMEGGRYLELELTPVNPSWASSWKEMSVPGGERLLWCGLGAFHEKNTNHRAVPGSGLSGLPGC